MVINNGPESKSVVAIVSGGLDSTVLAYKYAQESQLAAILSFNYGQKHSKELSFARKTAILLGVPHQEVNLLSVTPLLSGSALTDRTIAVPYGHYAEDNMKITVVPNRNAMMISIAWAYAVSIDAGGVAYAAHAGDASQYPDCRKDFVEALEYALNIGNLWAGRKRLLSPFVEWSKADIVARGAEIGVPFEQTWSCYEGGSTHCGRCGTCIERIEAFRIAKVKDPTSYIDLTFYNDMKARGEVA